MIVVTTTYGRTLAIDADSGQILWTFTPPGYGSWAGSAQITTASPLADPDRLFVYAASPDGLVHKLCSPTAAKLQRLLAGHDHARTSHEKIGSALNVDGPDLIAATSGYIGDTPPYQGHVVAIDRASGRIDARLQHALRQPPRTARPEHLPGERLGDPLARRRGRRAGRRAHPDRHRQRALERHDATSATACSS